MIKERSAAGGIAERPAERVLDQPLLVLRRIDLPDFLEPDTELRRLSILVEPELRDQLLGQAAARAFGKQRILAEQLHAAGVGSLVRAVARHAHVAGGDAAHLAVLAIEHFDRREARIDFHAQRFSAGAKPAAHVAQRADVAMMIVHQRRHHEVRQPDRAAARHPVEVIVLDLRLQRTISVLTPIRDQLVERDRIDHCAGQNMCADFRSLLDHHDREVGIDLLQPDRRAQAGRPGADDDNVELHGIARRKRLGAHALISKLSFQNTSNHRSSRFSAQEQPRFAAARSILH